jgi:hypothetical protein
MIVDYQDLHSLVSFRGRQPGGGKVPEHADLAILAEWGWADNAPFGGKSADPFGPYPLGAGLLRSGTLIPAPTFTE